MVEFVFEEGKVSTAARGYQSTDDIGTQNFTKLNFTALTEKFLRSSASSSTDIV